MNEYKLSLAGKCWLIRNTIVHALQWLDCRMDLTNGFLITIVLSCMSISYASVEVTISSTMVQVLLYCYSGFECNFFAKLCPVISLLCRFQYVILIVSSQNMFSVQKTRILYQYNNHIRLSLFSPTTHTFLLFFSILLYSQSYRYLVALSYNFAFFVSGRIDWSSYSVCCI